MSKKAALTLMEQMGTPREDGYNTIPPRSHRWMMDVGESEETRVVGWGLWRTIDYDPQGRTGPKKTRRTPAGWDERGYLDVKHMALDLDMSVPNATDALRRAVANGRMLVDEKGRIYVRGDAPLPQRIKRKPDSEEKKKGEQYFFCTENFPPFLILSFQSLDEKRREQYRRLYLAIPEPFANHLKQLDPQQRSSHTWRYLEAAEYKEQLVADAMAAGRAAGEEFVDHAMEDSGYEDRERRGRKPKPRNLIVSLTIAVKPQEFFSVQKKTRNFVQNPNPISYENENGAASLFSSSEFFRVSEWEEVVAGENSHSPTPKNPSHETEHEEASPVVEYVEERFGKFRMGDPVRTGFAGLAGEFGIPEVSVRWWIDDKIKEKERKRYSVASAGALLVFARSDLPRWIARNGPQIESDRKWERPTGKSREPSLAEQIESLEQLLEGMPDHAQAQEWREEIEKLKRKPVENEPSEKARKAGQACPPA